MQSKDILLNDVIIKQPPAPALADTPAQPKLHGSTAKGRGYNFSLTEIKEMKKKVGK